MCIDNAKAVTFFLSVEQPRRHFEPYKIIETKRFQYYDPSPNKTIKQTNKNLFRSLYFHNMQLLPR